MLHDLDKAIETIIYEQGKLNRKEVDISFEIPSGDWSARLNRPTINVWCFDLRENLHLRNATPSNSGRTGRITRISVPPRRFDLCYLVTAWVSKVEDEHQLLWRVLGALMQVPLLSPDLGGGALPEQEFDIPLVTAHMPEFPLNMTDLWSVINNEMHLGFTLMATIALNTGRGFELPLVFEKRLEVGQSDDPLQRQLTSSDGVQVQKVDPGSEGPSG